VHPPEGHTPLGAPPDDADRGRGGGRRISGSSATVHAAPELQGIQRLVHAAGLPALGCLLLVWSLTTLVGDVRWGPFSVLPVAFACLSPLIALPAILMIAMSVQRRRWATLVLPAAAVGLPWSFVVAYAIPADPPSGPTVPLRAMIVTAQDGQADAADIVAAVRSQRTDLLVVTELSSGLAHDITAAGLDRALVPRYVRVPDAGGSAAEGIAIYSRFAIDEKLVSTLPGTRWPAVVATVTVGPTQVTLVAGHASRPSAAHLDRWRRDLAAFRDVARIKGPVLVLANLDATPWNPQYRSVVSGRLHDAGDVLGQGLRPTWPTWAPVPLLATDHALVAGLGVTELNALAVKGSDHRALSVGLAVPTS
jgi:endonuclease/exonuclease/phosphatase (EEP) superfamily protein YafD